MFIWNVSVSLSHFKNLCIVIALKLVASVILLAALPVGASKIASLKSPSFVSLFICLYNSTIPFIIVVFPVPGPPVIIFILFSRDVIIAFS